MGIQLRIQEILLRRIHEIYRDYSYQKDVLQFPWEYFIDGGKIRVEVPEPLIVETAIFLMKTSQLLNFHMYRGHPTSLKEVIGLDALMLVGLNSSLLSALVEFSHVPVLREPGPFIGAHAGQFYTVGMKVPIELLGQAFEISGQIEAYVRDFLMYIRLEPADRIRFEEVEFRRLKEFNNELDKRVSSTYRKLLRESKHNELPLRLYYQVNFINGAFVIELSREGLNPTTQFLVLNYLLSNLGNE